MSQEVVACVRSEHPRTVISMTTNNNFWTTTAASSKDPTWTTPRGYWSELHKEFNFGLDAAAVSSSTLVADNWYGPDHPDRTRRDALARNWHQDTNQAVWLNPPYGRKTTCEFIKKAALEASNGLRVVCLVPARTDTAWWHDHVIDKCDIRFIRGRLKFGDGKAPAPFPSALLIYN